MSWDDLADDAAVRHHTFESMTGEDNERIRYGFWNGAKWQREQLRTDEAVERVANHLYQDEYGHPMAEHQAWCQIEDCTNTEDFRDSARAAITALLEQEPRP